MFNSAICGQALPRYVSTDHDPVFEAHRWTANLRILEVAPLLVVEKNLQGLTFLTIRRIRTKAPMEARIEHAKLGRAFNASLFMRSSVNPPTSLTLRDYVGCPRRRFHNPSAERMKVTPPSPPSAQSVQTKKNPPADLAISP